MKNKSKNIETNFGISENSLKLLIDTFSNFDEVEKVKIFGSRAIGNAKNGSDIDIVLYGKNLNDEIIQKIKIILNEKLAIPYFVDVLFYNDITNRELLAHIKEYGKLLYLKK